MTKSPPLGSRARRAPRAPLAATSPRAAPAAPSTTPLGALLSAPSAPARVTPLDVFELARRKWLAGERLDIGRLARELGVARATVFRWVGSREKLYGEVISALFAEELARARRAARGVGAAYMADVTHRLLHALLAAAPLRRFVRDDAELALRVLMSRASPVERRCTAAVRDALAEQVAAGHIRPAMPIEALAYVVVRIGESFLYRDVLTGDAPDVDTAAQAIRLLYAAEPETPRRRGKGSSSS